MKIIRTGLCGETDTELAKIRWTNGHTFDARQRCSAIYLSSSIVPGQAARGHDPLENYFGPAFDCCSLRAALQLHRAVLVILFPDWKIHTTSDRRAKNSNSGYMQLEHGRPHYQRLISVGGGSRPSQQLAASC